MNGMRDGVCQSRRARLCNPGVDLFLLSPLPDCVYKTWCMGVLGTQRKPTTLFSNEGLPCLRYDTFCLMEVVPVLELNFFLWCSSTHSWEESSPREGPGHERVGWEEAGVKAALFLVFRDLQRFWQSEGREDVSAHYRQSSLPTTFSVTSDVISWKQFPKAALRMSPVVYLSWRVQWLDETG